MGSIRAHTDSRAARQSSMADLRGGTSSCSLRPSHHQVIHKARPMYRPGTMPARNSLEIETFAATPKMTKPIDGGITGPMMPQAAISPPDRPLLCPALTIIGSSKAVSAAASATAEPDSADNRQAAMMVT